MQIGRHHLKSAGLTILVLAVLHLYILHVATHYKLAWLEHRGKIGTGMSQRDILSRWGEPHERFDRGVTPSPLKVAGFTPEIPKDCVVWLYRDRLSTFTFVVFGSDGRAVVIYSIPS